MDHEHYICTRELTAEDFDIVADICYRQHNYTPRPWMSKTFKRTFEEGVVCSVACFVNNEPASVFVATYTHDWFYTRLKLGPNPDVQARILESFREGEKPLMSLEELGRTNATPTGAHLLVLYYNQRRSVQNNRAMYVQVRGALLKHLKEHFSGNRINRISGELWPSEMRDRVKTMGFTPVNSYGVCPSGVWPEDAPCFVEFTRDSGGDAFLCEFMEYRRPDYKLTPREVEMLRIYAVNPKAVTSEVADKLVIAETSVEGIWERIRRRMKEQDEYRFAQGLPPGELEWLWSRKGKRDQNLHIVQHVRGRPSCLQPFAWSAKDDPQPRFNRNKP